MFTVDDEMDITNVLRSLPVQYWIDTMLPADPEVNERLKEAELKIVPEDKAKYELVCYETARLGEPLPDGYHKVPGLLTLMSFARFDGELPDDLDEAIGNATEVATGFMVVHGFVAFLGTLNGRDCAIFLHGDTLYIGTMETETSLSPPDRLELLRRSSLAPQSVWPTLTGKVKH
jgi:hypothetical protein